MCCLLLAVRGGKMKKERNLWGHFINQLDVQVLLNQIFKVAEQLSSIVMFVHRHSQRLGEMLPTAWRFYSHVPLDLRSDLWWPPDTSGSVFFCVFCANNMPHYWSWLSFIHPSIHLTNLFMGLFQYRLGGVHCISISHAQMVKKCQTRLFINRLLNRYIVSKNWSTFNMWSSATGFISFFSL